MKKSIFAAVVLSAAVLFSACDPNNGKTAVTGITINPSELPLNPGDESRLSITVTPEKATYNSDELVWESSDTSVVVVSMNGTVTALKEGTANVTVTYKELKSVCAVTVTSWEKNLAFTGAFIGVNDTAYYGDDLDTIKSITGQTYYVKTIQSIVMLFTAGFYMNDDFEFSGASKGGIIEAYAPMYFAPAWLNHTDKNTIFSLGGWYVYDTLYANCIPTGQVNDLFLTHMHLFLDNINAGDQTTAFSKNMKDAGELGTDGARLTVYEYHSTAEGYGEDGYYSQYLPELFMTKGYMDVEDNYTASSLLNSIEGHHLVGKPLKNTESDANSNFYAYGCHWHYDEAAESYSWVDEVVAFDEPYTYDRNLEIFENAPARERGEKLYKAVPVVHDMATTKAVREKLHSIPSVKKNVK